MRKLTCPHSGIVAVLPSEEKVIHAGRLPWELFRYRGFGQGDMSSSLGQGASRRKPRCRPAVGPQGLMVRGYADAVLMPSHPGPNLWFVGVS